MKNQKTSVIFGFRTVESALVRCPKNIKILWIAENRRDKRAKKLIYLAKNSGIKYEFKNRFFLSEISRGGKHQGFAAEGTFLSEQIFSLADIFKKDPSFFLVLDNIKDPRNLGACIRSADAAGADAVIISKNRTAKLTEAARKTAVGAAENIPLIQVPNLAENLNIIQKNNFFVVGLSDEAKKELYDIDFSGKIALVLGSEEDGLRRLTKENCDILAKIPMFGAVESLNVSVVAGIALFEVVRQRNAKKI